MIKKGIILAGGTGSRMSPITKAVNKQLLPIHDKPLIYYPLSVLMLANIKEVLIIVNQGQLNQFEEILGDGSRFGIKISYAEQQKPSGLPEAFIIGEEFIGKENVALILGDNFFYGQNLTKSLKECTKLKNGAIVFLHPVKNPNLYGVAKVNHKNKILQLVEKPKKPKSNLAVTGMYFFDNKVVELSKKLKPSKRNEIEIIDLLNIYKKNKSLFAEFIDRGGAWLDTGSFDDFYKTTAFVSAIENRQGLKVACLEEIAFLNKWIKKDKIQKAINFYGKCNYSNYLKKIIS